MPETLRPLAAPLGRRVLAWCHTRPPVTRHIAALLLFTASMLAARAGGLDGSLLVYLPGIAVAALLAREAAYPMAVMSVMTTRLDAASAGASLGILALILAGIYLTQRWIMGAMRDLPVPDDPATEEPAAAAPAADQAVEVAPAAPVPAPPRQRGGETILLAEDNAPLRAIMAQQLAELGYRVLEAEDGPSALRQVGPEVDLLVTDISMPGGMNGFDLAVAARARQPGLLVLIASARAEAMGGEETTPALPVLHKPFRGRDLARAVRQALDD